MTIQDDETLQMYLEESIDHLTNIENDFLAIEADGARINEELVNKVYRAAHSIKGGAGFMGLTNIKDLTHEMENILGKIRSREIVPSSPIINALLSATDTLKCLLKDILTSNNKDITAQIQSLQTIVPPVTTADPTKVKSSTRKSSTKKRRTPPEARQQTRALPQTEEEAALPPPSAGGGDENQASAPGETGEHGADRRIKFEHETSLRVHVGLLDQLMTLAGELVLSRNQLLQSMLSGDRRGSEVAGQRIDLITSELQEAIMLTRMQSIGHVFNKFPRVVRDLAGSLGKKAELFLEGRDVELDKTIIEAIGDPLTHLIRNAVDHGIETPQDRERMGKKPVGQIYLRAYHEAGQVNIEICDDGKGLESGKLAAKAVEKGLISEEQAKVMSNREKMNLIFLPGFSTVERVTDVSGRGVGMDVVKTNLDRLGGIIDLESEAGKGTTIRIKLPLTLAIIPCQIVVTGGERYAIPQVNLEELLRIPAGQIQTRIERVGNASVVRLRGNLLPLIRLSDVLGADSCYSDSKTGQLKENRRQDIADRRARKSQLITVEESAAADSETQCLEDKAHPSPIERQTNDRRYHAASALNIVVVSTGALTYGLIVDNLHDSEEIVVKPLGRDLKKCQGYAGATIMGDGRVALILDVSNIARMASLTSVDNSVRAIELAASEQETARSSQDTQSLLVFRSAASEQFAAPLGLVERIEKIKRSDIEEVGGKQVIKYRSGSLPLFKIDQVADVKPLAEGQNLLVIVFKAAGREIGLLATGPVDAIELSLSVDSITLRQPGIMGSTIINDTTTLLIDIEGIVQTINPDWFKETPQVETSAGHVATILFAEDSGFFRNQVKSSIEKEGFKVLEAADGVAAWDILQKNFNLISLVVTDLEMPNMDGLTLTKRIKQHPSYSHLPVIALTTLAGDEDISRGKAAGIDDYQIKLDREKLIRSIVGFLKAA